MHLPTWPSLAATLLITCVQTATPALPVRWMHERDDSFVINSISYGSLHGNMVNGTQNPCWSMPCNVSDRPIDSYKAGLGM